MRSTFVPAAALAAGLLFSMASHAQTSTDAARCTELSKGVKNEFDRRLQSMAPKVAPSVYVDQNTDALKILQEQVGGGSFMGINIGGLIGSVANKYLSGNMAANAFTQNINGVLSSWGTQSIGMLGGGNLATPGFAPPAGAAGAIGSMFAAPAAAAPAQAQPSFFQRLFGGSSGSTATPYQK